MLRKILDMMDLAKPQAKPHINQRPQLPELDKAKDPEPKRELTPDKKPVFIKAIRCKSGIKGKSHHMSLQNLLKYEAPRLRNAKS
jgi:hypothetical protein